MSSSKTVVVPFSLTRTKTNCISFHLLSLSYRYGDGWNSNELNVFDCNGNPLEVGITLSHGSSGEADICIPEAEGYIIHVAG